MIKTIDQIKEFLLNLPSDKTLIPSKHLKLSFLFDLNNFFAFVYAEKASKIWTNKHSPIKKYKNKYFYKKLKGL